MKNNLRYALYWSIPMTIIFWFFSNLFKNNFRLYFLKDTNTLSSISVIFIIFYVAGFIITIVSVKKSTRSN